MPMIEYNLLQKMACDKPTAERFEDITQSIQEFFQCGAVVLLKLSGDQLKPLAMTGLVIEAHGRRFKLAQHPRLAAVMTSSKVLRFPIGSPLPDPYDGLLASAPGEVLPVHDCMGIRLNLNNEPWGALTLDSLSPGAFENERIQELERLRPLLETAIRLINLEEDLRSLHQTRLTTQAGPAQESECDIIGQSEAILHVRKELKMVADSDLPVLLLGETGVGKEIFANFLHRHSARADQPLQYINCAALPEHLAESELFGHTQGAFSGAHEDRIGRIEGAHKGTLFLDEVGVLPLAAQAKLLRVLQKGEVLPLGSDSARPVDVRIIAATNRNLKEQVTEGVFRADLYHRLSVYPIPIPPLRERGKDISLLAGHFLELNRARLGLRSLRLSPDAEAALLAYSWPGNVRELEHAISRAAIKALSAGAQKHDIVTLESPMLDLRLISADPKEKPCQGLLEQVAGMSMKEAVKVFQKAVLMKALKQQDGSWSATARELGLDPSNLHKLAQKLGVK